jgi:hypothetical protein
LKDHCSPITWRAITLSQVLIMQELMMKGSEMSEMNLIIQPGGLTIYGDQHTRGDL